MYLCFADVKIGDLWTPADPPPPSGTFEITHQGFCLWESSDANYTYQYATVPDFSDVTVFTPGFETAFWKRHVGICYDFWLNNIQVPAGNKWYGGYCFLLNTLPGGFTGISDILSLLSDDPSWAKWLNPVPIDIEVAIHKLYNPLDRTNVKVKIDNS